jgi:hypothetical protein
MNKRPLFKSGLENPPNFFDTREIDICFREKVNDISHYLPYWFVGEERYKAAKRQAYWELGYEEEAERYK